MYSRRVSIRPHEAVNTYLATRTRLWHSTFTNQPEPPLSFQELHVLQSAAEVEHWFSHQVILPVIHILKERQVAQSQLISEKVIAIIQQDYDKDLTLEECAVRLHYNANYLSSVFRKETGASFSEYLTRYRLNVAKRWLDESDWTVKEIAERLRYTNPQNFIRSFRKWEGMTPGRYRERMKQPERAVKG